MIDRAGSPSAAGPIASSASRQATGPAPQFTPIAVRAGRGQRSGRRRGLLPSARTSSSPKVSEAMIGTSDARRASSTAEHELLEVREGLEHDQVRATLEQPVDLLPERGPGSGLRHGGPAASRWTQRSDRTADQGVATADLAGLPGQLRRAPAESRRPDLRGPRRQAVDDWPRTTGSRSARRPPRGTHDGLPRPSPGGSRQAPRGRPAGARRD